jgi:hypothetical protein
VCVRACVSAWQSVLALQGPIGGMHPVSSLTRACGKGVGMAVCLELGILVTSSHIDNKLSTFAFPGSGASARCGAGAGSGVGGGAGVASTSTGTLSHRGSSFSLLHQFGDEAPFDFCFESATNCYSGYLAFMPSDGDMEPIVVVTDAGNGAVHVVNVMDRAHLGYVARPGSISGPKGVAAARDCVAVSAWTQFDTGSHIVRVYCRHESEWRRWRDVGVDCGAYDHQLCRPYGLRFSGDGAHVSVADCGNGRVSLFRLCDGAFVRHIAKGLDGPRDVQECKEGWIVACMDSNTVQQVPAGPSGRSALGRYGGGSSLEGEFRYPSAVALVRGFGLVVREILNDGRIQVFK